MNEDALAIANYFIDLARRDGEPIKPLKLMKLVYIAHGYMLAILGYSALNPRFNKVEAWKYGPVIPSVYHSFKHFGNNPITERTTIFEGENDGVPTIVEPALKDERERQVCGVVWDRYRGYSDNELVTLMHGVGTPWAKVYKAGQNLPIPDEYTKAYYSYLIEKIIESKDV
ncbi:Panacea domain-containing protein [Bacteroides pyogenes]|uniref:Panacea domain-containing protein n=1 Tax=Bacteroides pyogenes TaxID=310300 RepID=UPI002FDB74AC